MKNITVVGGGIAGHLATLFLAKNNLDKNIKWIYPENNNPIDAGEAADSDVQEFLKELGIDIRTIITKANGNLKLGAKLENFFKETRYLPFGHTFQNCLLFIEYMKNNKVPKNILEFKDIAYHFNTRGLCSVIQKLVNNLSHVTIERRFYTDSDINSNDTLIVDCTGFSRKILDSKNKDNFYKEKRIHSDRALIHRELISLDKLYSTFTVLNYGWAWEIPLYNETSYGYVFDSSRMNNKEANDIFYNFLKNKGYKTNGQYSLIPMISGRNKKHFYNVEVGSTITSIGLGQCFIEPIESTGLYFICYGLDLLQKVIDKDITQSQYSNRFNNEFDNIAEFIIAHFSFSDHLGFKEYQKYNVKINVESDLFGKTSWDFLLKQEYSVKIPPINNQSIKLLEGLKSFREINLK